jgi:hypothetical protein
MSILSGSDIHRRPFRPYWPHAGSLGLKQPGALTEVPVFVTVDGPESPLAFARDERPYFVLTLS